LSVKPMSSDDVIVVFAPRLKAEDDPRNKRLKYQITANVEPNTTARATISTPFKQPFVMISLLCDEPSARAQIIDICGSKVGIAITSNIACVATAYVTIEETEGAIFKSAVRGKSVMDSSPMHYSQQNTGSQ